MGATVTRYTRESAYAGPGPEQAEVIFDGDLVAADTLFLRSERTCTQRHVLRDADGTMLRSQSYDTKTRAGR